MNTDMRNGLIAGLMSTPKYIPTWYRYDEEGSRLSDRCLEENEKYYLHRCECEIIKRHVTAMAAMGTQNEALVDLGSGNCFKTRFFMKDMLKSQETLKYFPIDISKDFLLVSCRTLEFEFGKKLDITPIAADYNTGLIELRKFQDPKLILWFGSIQNLAYDDQVRKLRTIGELMTDECRLIISVDITQDRQSVMNAYADKHGKHFHWNFMKRLQREEGCTLRDEDVGLEVEFVLDQSPSRTSYVRVLLRAKTDVSFSVPGLGLDMDMKKGEPLYLQEGDGVSCKYTPEQIRTIIDKAGLETENMWTDEHRHAVFCKCKTTRDNMDIKTEQRSNSI